MCEVLGIVEIDYFGLKYADRLAGCEAWINTRSNLRRQLKHCRTPYRLGFRVKFFTEPNLLQQPSTRSVHVHALLCRLTVRDTCTCTCTCTCMCIMCTHNLSLPGWARYNYRCTCILYTHDIIILLSFLFDTSGCIPTLQ